MFQSRGMFAVASRVMLGRKVTHGCAGLNPGTPFHPLDASKIFPESSAGHEVLEKLVRPTPSEPFTSQWLFGYGRMHSEGSCGTAARNTTRCFPPHHSLHGPSEERHVEPISPAGRSPERWQQPLPGGQLPLQL